MEECKNAFKILTDKPKQTRSLGKLIPRSEDSNKMNLEEIDDNTRNWINSTQDMDYWRALGNVALNLQIP